MNKISLSALYQRMTANQSAAGDVSSEDLAAVAEGSLAADRRDAAASAIAASSAQAKLVRMLRDLAPESATLASVIGNTERVTGHRRHQRGERRIAAERRRTGVARWTALAACMVAAIGAFTLQHSLGKHASAPAMHSVAHADRIFSSNDTIFGDAMDRRGAHDAQKGADGDHLFHGSFSGG